MCKEKNCDKESECSGCGKCQKHHDETPNLFKL